jgi:hypothetical protein
MDGKLNAAFGHLDVDEVSNMSRDRLDNDIARFAIKLSHSSDMAVQKSLPYEVGDHCLQERRRLPVGDELGAGEDIDKVARDDGEPDACAGKQHLAECSNIDHPGAVIDPLQRCKGSYNLSEFTVVIVLNDPGVSISCPGENVEPTSHRHHDPGWVLVRWGNISGLGVGVRSLCRR